MPLKSNSPFPKKTKFMVILSRPHTILNVMGRARGRLLFGGISHVKVMLRIFSQSGYATTKYNLVSLVNANLVWQVSLPSLLFPCKLGVNRSAMTTM